MKSVDPAGKMFEDLGLALRILREHSGLSQAELARRAGVGKSQLSQYERRKQLPSFDSLGRILAAMDATPLVLFYVSSVIEKGPRFSEGYRAELLDQGATTFLRSDQESRQYRELFDRFFALFEEAVEARVTETLARNATREET